VDDEESMRDDGLEWSSQHHGVGDRVIQSFWTMVGPQPFRVWQSFLGGVIIISSAIHRIITIVFSRAIPAFSVVAFLVYNIHGEAEAAAGGIAGVCPRITRSKNDPVRWFNSLFCSVFDRTARWSVRNKGKSAGLGRGGL
jgi:hypothetical protein